MTMEGVQLAVKTADGLFYTERRTATNSGRRSRWSGWLRLPSNWVWKVTLLRHFCWPVRWPRVDRLDGRVLAC